MIKEKADVIVVSQTPEKALDKFFNLNYEDKYKNKLIEEFEKCLPLNPSWEV
jgi:hypothetical protein